MNLLKEIKEKTIGSNKDKKEKDKKENKEKKIEKCDKEKLSGGLLKDINFKTFAMSFMGKDKNKLKNNSESNQLHENDHCNEGNIDEDEGKNRIWKTAPVQNIDSKIQESYAEDYEIPSEEEACSFIQNLCTNVSEYVKEEEMKVRKARNNLFGGIELEPIYMSEGIQVKIFQMELESEFESLIERTQILVLEKNTIDRTIERALMSGYLWEANGLLNEPFIEVCFETIQNGYENTVMLYERTVASRERLKFFRVHFQKILALNQRRIVLAKKLQLLSKIKSYAKDVNQQFVNIDQAFYIERSRQKLYKSFEMSNKLVEKVRLLQNMKNKLNNQNKKLVELVEKELGDWIDENKDMENKHIEKLLILLYFIKNEPMYCELNKCMDLTLIKNQRKLIYQVEEVRNWPDYKYVNDKSIKVKVKEFLKDLIDELNEKFEGKAKETILF